MYNIALQVQRWQLVLQQKNDPGLLWRDPAKQASYVILRSIPNNLPNLAVLLIFGTTRVFRARLYKALRPKRWQRYDEDTPLETPYKSAQPGRKRFAGQAPRIDLNFTTASLRWNQGDIIFAAWESRALDHQRIKELNKAQSAQQR